MTIEMTAQLAPVAWILIGTFAASTVAIFGSIIAREVSAAYRNLRHDAKATPVTAPACS